MAEGTMVADSRKRDESSGKKYLVRQVGGEGKPTYLDFGDICTIGRSDENSGWVPNLSFTDKNVSRVHALVYLNKEDGKCYLMDVSLKGVFPATYKDPIKNHNGRLIVPGGSVVPIGAIINPLKIGILAKNLAQSQIDYIMNAIKMQYKMDSNGMPTSEMVARENVARAAIEFYYPRDPATGPRLKREARFRLARPDSDLEIIVESV